MRAFDERSIAVVPYFEAALYQLADETLTPEAVRLEFPILSLHPGLRQRCVAPDDSTQFTTAHYDLPLRPRGVAPDVWPTLSRAAEGDVRYSRGTATVDYFNISKGDWRNG